MSKNKIKICPKCQKIQGKEHTQMQGCKCLKSNKTNNHEYKKP